MSVPTPTDDPSTADDVRDLLSEWSRLPYPLEAAVLREANDPGPAVRRAAEMIHRAPPGSDTSTRTVWVVAGLEAEQDDRVRLRDWCWYATRSAAAAAAGTGPALLHEVSVPRTVRCEGVESYLGRYYRVAPRQADA